MPTKNNKTSALFWVILALLVIILGLSIWAIVICAKSREGFNGNRQPTTLIKSCKIPEDCPAGQTCGSGFWANKCVDICSTLGTSLRNAPICGDLKKCPTEQCEWRCPKGTLHGCYDTKAKKCASSDWFRKNKGCTAYREPGQKLWSDEGLLYDCYSSGCYSPWGITNFHCSGVCGRENPPARARGACSSVECTVRSGPKAICKMAVDAEKCHYN